LGRDFIFIRAAHFYVLYPFSQPFYPLPCKNVRINALLGFGRHRRLVFTDTLAKNIYSFDEHCSSKEYNNLQDFKQDGEAQTCL
jgi:hypothetical protein